VADEESIAFAYTMAGTHQGVLMGIAPTGKKISIRGRKKNGLCERKER
jgi:predicted ester cyclase